MQNNGKLALRQTFVSHYEEFVGRLTRRLRSADSAYEAIQDAFVKLESMVGDREIKCHKAYIFQTAMNAARDRRKAHKDRLSASAVRELTDVADDSPSPAKSAEARSELAAFQRAISELPPRRRAILEASLFHELPRRDIARRFGVSERTIDFELKRAIEHGREALRK